MGGTGGVVMENRQRRQARLFGRITADPGTMPNRLIIAPADVSSSREGERERGREGERERERGRGSGL